MVLIANVAPSHDHIALDTELYDTPGNNHLSSGATQSTPAVAELEEVESTVHTVQSSIEVVEPLSETHSILHEQPLYVDDDASVAETCIGVDGEDQGTAPDFHAFDRALQEAHLVNSRSTEQKLPWECGVMASIFDDKTTDLPSLLKVAAIQPDGRALMGEDEEVPLDAGLEGSSGSKRKLEGNIFSGVVRMLKDVDHIQASSELWSRALTKWQVVLECTGFSGILGTTVHEALETDQDPMPYIRDVMGTKSPRTVNKRASTMLAVFDWMRNRGFSVWPLGPSEVLLYMNEAMESHYGSTRGRTLLEALRFCKHVVRLPDLDAVLDNPIVAGKSKRMDAERQTIRQCRPLTVDEVRKLEAFLYEEHDLRDRYICGCIVFALFSRSRWSDLAFLEELMLDVSKTALGLFGFVEASTKHQKTGTNALKKSLQMPLVAPIHGVGKEPWALQWFDILDEIKFDYMTRPVGALCRPPHATGLGMRTISSDEIGKFLNEVLGLTGASVVTSHCLKTTTLTWASKYGLDEPSRTLLGHHELESKSLACYSRDMLSRPLALYQAMLENIRSNNFQPDVSRSGRFAMELFAGGPEEEQLPNVEAMQSEQAFQYSPSEGGFEHVQPRDYGKVLLERDEMRDMMQHAHKDDFFGEDPAMTNEVLVSDDSSESSSSSSSSALEESLHMDFGMKNEAKECPGPLYQHKKSRVLHKPSKRDDVLFCGRRIGNSYNFLETGASFKWARCSFCFKGEVVTTVDGLVEKFEKLKERSK